ncbi:hypothetical protein RHMOL_Rhmol13G0242800 [Rhododendron molle]|uniref:Uncharacterized protein n=1 Tax=Rhododendron molle TaxID=49168 RepID=A0ACC0LA53_RHOML|nr:hypothetical protein RHMOL_Rhmol13G0242800 [Rhododendron molle]
MVIRDSTGCFVAAHSISLGSTGSAHCAEAGACRAALEFAEFWGMSRIRVQGDS